MIGPKVLGQALCGLSDQAQLVSLEVTHVAVCAASVPRGENCLHEQQWNNVTMHVSRINEVIHYIYMPGECLQLWYPVNDMIELEQLSTSSLATQFRWCHQI